MRHKKIYYKIDGGPEDGWFVNKCGSISNNKEFRTKKLLNKYMKKYGSALDQSTISRYILTGREKGSRFFKRGLVTDWLPIGE